MNDKWNVTPEQEEVVKNLILMVHRGNSPLILTVSWVHFRLQWVRVFIDTYVKSKSNIFLDRAVIESELLSYFMFCPFVSLWFLIKWLSRCQSYTQICREPALDICVWSNYPLHSYKYSQQHRWRPIYFHCVNFNSNSFVILWCLRNRRWETVIWMHQFYTIRYVISHD